ncbi:hypothetical protein Drorol1_Dr00013313 [Drosera rotundifolia]
MDAQRALLDELMGTGKNLMEEEKKGYREIKWDDEEESDLLSDRFRLIAISIAESEAKKIGMEISESIVACVAAMAFKHSNHLAKDLELFAHHAGRKIVNMEDVIVAAHRNETLALSLRSFRNHLKAKDPQSEKRRRQASRKEDKDNPSAAHVVADGVDSA